MIKSSMKQGFIVLLCLFFLCLFFIIPKNEREISKDMQMKEHSFIEGLKIIQRVNGNTIWTLAARKADFIEGGDKAELSDVQMTVQKNGLFIHSDKGTYNLLNQNFTTEGTIRAEAKNYLITADSIDYEASSGEMKTEGQIKIEGKRFNIIGKGMKASENGVRILKDVKATFYR